MPFEVVTFGETMLRLSPPNHQLIEQATTLDLFVGGSESNVAVGLSRLGVKSAWFSALPDNALGHYVSSKIAAQGVDTSFIVWSTEGRLGQYWVEQGASPRTSQVVYDRAHTAISQMTPDQLPKALFEADGVKLLHLSGITPALSPHAAETTLQALTLAKRAGWQVSFDLNYRAKLWDREAARAGCLPFIQQADIVFAPQRDIQQIYGFDDVAQFHALCPQSLVVMTVGSDGAIAHLPDGTTYHESALNASIVDRIGAGDAFVAGFLSQYVSENFDLQQALHWANACAALKYTIPGDMPLLSKNDVLASGSQHIHR